MSKMATMKCVKLDKKSVPVNQVLQIKMVCVSDEIFYEVEYWYEGWRYATLLPRDKGYELEKTVRKAMAKR